MVKGEKGGKDNRKKKEGRIEREGGRERGTREKEESGEQGEREKRKGKEGGFE